MARYAVVNNVGNVVDNLIIWDGVATWSPPASTSAVVDNKTTPAKIGGTYDSGIPDFVDPA